MVNLVQTGISGLDKMLHGGIPEGNQVILAGGPGAGKTLLSFEYLYRNALVGEVGLFLTLDETPERVLDNAKNAFSELKDIDKLVKNKALVIKGQLLSSSALKGSGTFEFGKIISDIESTITTIGAERVVIDNLSVLSLLALDDIGGRNSSFSYRRSMLALVSNLRRLGVVSILTYELSSPERAKLDYKPEYFIYDGIIAMYQTGEEYKRMLAIEVIKMRGTEHSFITTPYEITPNGFKVFSTEEATKY